MSAFLQSVAVSIRRWSQSRPAAILFRLFCLFPVVAGIIAKLQKNRWTLMDIDAVLCGASRLSQGLSPYTHTPVCAGLRPAAFVYAPQVASLFSAPVQQFGALFARDLFVWALLFPATAFLVWFALVKAMPQLRLSHRLLAFSALSAMTFCCGNIGIVMHAAVLAGLLAAPRKKWLFTLVVLACAYIKPTFLMYFVVFLLEDRPLWPRFAAFGWRAVAGIGVVALMFATTGHYGGEWRALLKTVAIEEQPGLGWLALTSWAGVITSSVESLAFAALFMAVMLASGMAMAKWGDLDDNERLILGLGLTPLMTPRLMDYDMILIVPYAALLMSIAGKLPGRIFRTNVTWLFTGVLTLGIMTDLFHIKAYHRTHTAMFLFAGLTLFVGFRLAWRHSAQIEQRFMRIWRALAGKPAQAVSSTNPY